MLALKNRGNVREFACVYHNWTYDLTGKLTGVAFRRGIKGSGGMLPDAQPDAQAPRRLKVENYHGLLFGTLADDMPPVDDEEELDEEEDDSLAPLHAVTTTRSSGSTRRMDGTSGGRERGA